MHWIQKHILKKLTVSDGLRYIELKPENAEGNLFMYHLNQLMDAHYVKKIGKLYALSDIGKSYVGRMSLAKGKKTVLPTILVMLFCKNKKGEYLFYRWTRQPHRNLISLPFSRVRFGQSVFDAVKENQFYKTSLSGKTKYIGDIYIRASVKGDVAEHYLAHIFRLDRFSGDLGAEGLTGQPFWGSISGYKPAELVSGLEEIIKIIENKKSPFFEEIIVLKD